MPANEVRISIPLIPPSVNHYKRTSGGRYFVTKEAVAFMDAIALLRRGQSITAKFYTVAADIFLGFGKRGDVDNFAKCILDGLVKAGVIHSDAAVEELTLRKHRDRGNPRTEIVVRGI